MLRFNVDPSVDKVGVDSTGGVLRYQRWFIVQPSIVTVTHQVHKVVSFIVHIIQDSIWLFIQIRSARQERRGAPNRLPQSKRDDLW